MSLSSNKIKTNSNNRTKAASRKLEEETPKQQELRELVNKYARGDVDKMSTRTIKKHKHLKKTLTELKEKITSAAAKTASTEILNEAEDGYIEAEGNERTFKLTQNELKQHVDLNTEKNILSLQLTKFGPYRTSYSRNGRFMVCGGQKGHIALLDCLKLQVGMELQLKETVNDVHFLHNESLFAAAQKNYTYIYDHRGVEIHCIKSLERTYRLGFLPYHYLLSSIGHSGYIKWTDVSIGEYVAGFSTGMGPSYVLKTNPHNAVSHVGHTNGVVSLWSPASGKALVSMFCHKAPVTDVAIDRSGNYMATAGYDSMMKIWDLRKYTCIHAYKTDHPVQSLDFSDKGLLAMGIDRTVQILKDCHISPVTAEGPKGKSSNSGRSAGGTVSSTYMRYEVLPPRDPSFMTAGGGVNANKKNLASSIQIKSVKFRPLEDVLAIGHTHGLNTILVPGAGEANYDAFEANPFVNQKQRREQEIQGLLYKLPYDTIGLDAGFVGKLDKDSTALRKEHREVFEEANKKKEEALIAKGLLKKRARGRNKISAKLKRRQKNVVDAQTVKLKQALDAQKEERQAQFNAKRDPNGAAEAEGVKNAYDPLARFGKKEKDKFSK